MKEPERNRSYTVWCLIVFQISENYSSFDCAKNHEYEPLLRTVTITVKGLFLFLITDRHGLIWSMTTWPKNAQQYSTT